MPLLTYRGYHASAEYYPDDKIIFGEVLDLDDTVIFEVRDAAEVEAAFHAAVDDYLAHCERIGKPPDKPYSGRFNLRLPPHLHRAATMAAKAGEESLNAFVGKAIEREVKRRGREIV